MEGGSIYHCCPTWLPHTVANITEVSLLDACRTEKSRAIQREVMHGNFSYCETKLCPYLSQYANLGQISGPMALRRDLPRMLKDHSPEHSRRVLMMLNYDASCNLRCPSCRNETILFNDANMPPRLREVHEAVQRNIRELREAGYSIHLNVTGAGDAFASPLYSNLLRSLPYDPNLQLELQTNGVLMEEKRFTDPMFRMLRFLAVSVDAATPESYAKVRRGGNFERLRKNLDWVNEALRAGRFQHPVYYKVNFIVQRDNFREMADFARWILGYESVKEIWFNCIADWGHLPTPEFSGRAVWQAGHPDHEEFLAVAGDPVLRNPRINLGNVSAFAMRGSGA
jgi:sulfatase maturation enzyme AslB (radical SAM superfamily)